MSLADGPANMNTCAMSVADPGICPRGPNDSQNLHRNMAAIFFSLILTGGGPQGPTGSAAGYVKV